MSTSSLATRRFMLNTLNGTTVHSAIQADASLRVVHHWPGATHCSTAGALYEKSVSLEGPALSVYFRMVFGDSPQPRRTPRPMHVFVVSSGSSNGKHHHQLLGLTRSGTALAVEGGADAAFGSGCAALVAFGRP